MTEYGLETGAVRFIKERYRKDQIMFDVNDNYNAILNVVKLGFQYGLTLYNSEMI